MSKSEIDKLTQIVDQHYSHICKGIEDIREVRGHECNNENYRVQTSRESEVRKLLLKKFVTLKDPKIISEILRVVNYCHSQGAKVPHLLKTDAEELFFREGENYYCAFEFYEGHHFNGSIDELRSAARGLANLHKVLDGYNWTVQCERSDLYRFLSDDEIKEVRGVVGGKAKEDFDRVVLENLNKISGLYKEVSDKLSRANLPDQLIHNDFHIMNGLFRNGELIVILDFDSIGTSERARDVAFSCYRFSRYTREGLAREDMGSRATEFLENYCVENQLTEEEINTIPTLLIHEALKRVSYILRSHYFQKDTTWSFDLPKHLRTIEDAQYLKNIS